MMNKYQRNNLPSPTQYVFTKHKVTVNTRRIYALASEGFRPSGLFQGEAEIMHIL